MPRRPTRRRLLRAAVAGAVGVTAGCSGEANRPGRIDPIGHHRLVPGPFYTFGHLSPHGEWGVVGSYPGESDLTASTLIDLGNLERPRPTHALDASDPETRTNDVKFDAHRDGLYYRTQEPAAPDGTRGVEVIDFGFRDGSPSDPVVAGRFDPPDTGVHKLTTHPDEKLVYVVDTNPSSGIGVLVVDVRDPSAPELVDTVGPGGFCHDLEYDATRQVLHAAYILGPAEGYVAYDASDPWAPRELGQFRYDDQPDYSEVGEPGFEHCHQAHPEPDRDLVIIGDEVRLDVPGGKHVLDIGWDSGSLEDPQPIGFTHAPDAREMDAGEDFWWTTHFHDIVSGDGPPLLVDGGYRQGAWVCTLGDPRNPTPAERFATVDQRDDEAVPMAWGAVYDEERDFAFVTDGFNGVFTFRVSAEPARGPDGHGPEDHYPERFLTEAGPSPPI